MMTDRALTRRKFLTQVGTGIGMSMVALPLIGCGTDTSDSSSSNPDAGSASDAGDTSASADAGDTSTSGIDENDPSTWLSGGTDGMSGNYDDPFTGAAACALTCVTTEGPCDAQSPVRQDISEGYPGLPLRLALKIVDTDCEPISGAVVDVWHCRNTGLYSGSDAIDFCTDGDSDARSHRYFRGTQTTDSEGRVDFDSCYPGWYSSRTIHIHFRVRVNDEEYVVSQIVFPDALNKSICENHPDYSDRGAPDTLNTGDTVIPADDVDTYVLNTQLQSDGAMLAYKTLTIRSSLSESVCSI